MKYAREIKVGALSLVCLFLLYFGFYYLKGVNIFSSVRAFHGQYEQVSGLQEQAPVYIKGFKVGQVDHIHYDFTRDTAFIIDISVKKDIRLPKGTTMALISDGLLGGTAIQLNIPSGYIEEEYQADDYLPTLVVPGLLDNIQDGVMGQVSTLVQHADSLIVDVQSQLAGNHLYNTLNSVDQVSKDLTSVSRDLQVVSSDVKNFTQKQLPGIVEKVDSTMIDLNVVVNDLREADVKSVIARVDTAVHFVKNPLLTHIDATIVSADSLITDLKAHPKRYVHFSLFGKKEK